MGKLENLSKVKCLQLKYKNEETIDEARLEFNTHKDKQLMIKKDWRLECIWILENAWEFDE